MITPIFRSLSVVCIGALLCTLTACTLTACDSSAPIVPLTIDDTTYRSSSYGDRIRFIVVHYTATDNQTSLDLLTQGKVSSHYLVMQGNYPVYQLVDDNKSAWHAGASSFRGMANLNDNSIGIEIVNEGVLRQYREMAGYPPYHHYADYDERQIRQVGELLHSLSQKYNISPRNIVAHSDVAPDRKSDPGAKFPWERLYRDYGVGAWYDERDKRTFMQMGFEEVSISDIKAELRQYGYPINNTNVWDKPSRDVVYAFQLHFNPKNATGEMDLETYAILKALNKKYVYKER